MNAAIYSFDADGNICKDERRVRIARRAASYSRTCTPGGRARSRLADLLLIPEGRSFVHFAGIPAR